MIQGPVNPLVLQTHGSFFRPKQADNSCLTRNLIINAALLTRCLVKLCHFRKAKKQIRRLRDERVYMSTTPIHCNSYQHVRQGQFQ